jgi:hypothetical protein
MPIELEAVRIDEHTYEVRQLGADWPVAEIHAWRSKPGREPLNDPAEDASLIVRAINHHANLVRELSEFTAWMEEHGHLFLDHPVGEGLLSFVDSMNATLASTEE